MNQNPNFVYDPEDEEIDLRILIYKALAQWRKALILGLAVAVILMGYSVVKTMSASKTEVWTGNSTVYVNVNAAKGLSEEQLTEKTNELIAVYTSYINGAGIYNDVAEKLPSYSVAGLKNQITFTVDKNGKTISFTVTEATETACKELAKTVKSVLKEKSAKLQSVIPHELSVVNDVTYSENTSSPEFKSGIKKAAIGFVIGIFCVCAYYAFMYVLSQKFTIEKLSACTNCYVIGEVYLDSEPKTSKFDEWLKKIFGIDQNKTDFESGCTLVQANIERVLANKETKSLAAVGAVDAETAKKIVGNPSVSYVGNILTDGDAIKALEPYENVCILAQENVNTTNDIIRQIENLNVWGKKNIGIIVVK